MGLLSAISTAVTGLNVNQQNLNVLSQNITNANTANYSSEKLDQQASYNGGLGTGVNVEGIKRTVDTFLTAEVQTQTSASSSAQAVQGYYSQIQNLLGQPGASNSIDSNINSFFTSIQDLANSPSVSSETTAVNSGVALAGSLSTLAGSLQNLRLQADSDIGTSVNAVNADLQTLYSTNNAIERASATKQSTAGLLDTRDAALTDIAQYLDINPTYKDDGEVSLNTSNGLTLLDGSSLTKLAYTPVGSTQALENNASLSPVQIYALDASGNTTGQPMTLVTGGKSSSVSTSLTGGKIQGLLSVRDTIVPNILTQLDQLASTLRDSMNAISNQGSSFPPPSSYTGARLVAGSDTSQWSGTAQLALLDTSGNPVNSPYADETNGLQPLTLNLAGIQGAGGTGTLSTDDIIKSINQYYGTPQNKTEIGNINNVQLGVLSNSVPAAGNTLNLDFNLNNISSTSANFFVTGVSVTDSNGAALPGSDVASSVPSLAIGGFHTTAGSDTVTVSVPSAAGLTNGETVYLNAPSAAVNGVPASALSGYFTIGNVTGTSFDITAAGAGATASTGNAAGGGAAALTPYATVASGQTLRTGTSGGISLSGLSTSSAYYTVNATIGTLDASGKVVTSTVSYTVPNNTQGSLNDLIGANSATGNAKIVQPNTTQALATATLVDANGNPLPTQNGSYGNQSGYLKITANNASYTLAMNQLSSKQQGLPLANPAQAGTNQGFSQYFGLNNFFNANTLTATGDTLANSALNLSVSNRIVADPGLIPTGTLSQSVQPATAGSPPNFTYRVASGDNSVSQQMASLATATQTFNLAGGLPKASTTLAQYAGQIIAKTSSDSTDATNTMNDSQTLLSGFTTRAQSVSGVNLDQELANTVIYQNAYSASTRIITVVGDMFTQLLQSIS